MPGRFVRFLGVAWSGTLILVILPCAGLVRVARKNKNWYERFPCRAGVTAVRISNSEDQRSPSPDVKNLLKMTPVASVPPNLESKSGATSPPVLFSGSSANF